MCGDAGPAGITPRKAGKCKRLGREPLPGLFFGGGRRFPKTHIPPGRRIEFGIDSDRGGSVMAARHVGRRIGTVSSQHRAAERRRRSTPAAPHRVQRGKRETLTPGERQHLCAAGGGEAPAAGTHGPGECQAHRNAGTEHRCAGRVLRCGAGRERRSGCGRGPSGYVSGGVRPSGGFRRGGVSPGRGRGGVSPASCGHRAPAGLPDRDRQQRRLADSRGRSDSGDCGNRIPGRGGGVYPGLRPLLRPEPAGQRVPGTGPAGL